MKEITIDGVEYTLTPKVKEDEFTYPIWFKSKLGSICRFDSLNKATCLQAGKGSPWNVGEKVSGTVPHTDKNHWTQVPEPKKTKIVYEWIVKPSTHNSKYPKIAYLLLDEEEDKERFRSHTWYKKTGREFEVEI